MVSVGQIIDRRAACRSDRNREPIQEGSTVRERQLLIRLPDTDSMKAVVRILEAQVNKLSVDQKATVQVPGLRRPISATLTRIAVLSDSSQRWWNPDLKEYPVELTLDHTPANLKPGQSVDAEIIVSRGSNGRTPSINR